MISRHWTGICKNERSGEYLADLKNETIPALQLVNGFISATVFHREVEKGTEFLVTTLWDSPDAIREFAGVNAIVAVIPENVRAMMVQYDEFVRHYEVV